MSDDMNQAPSQPAPAEPPAQPAAYPPPSAAPPAGQPAPYAPPPPSVPGYQAGYAPSSGPPQPPAKKSRKGLWIALAIIAFLFLCCGGTCIGYFVYNAAQERAAYQRANDTLEKGIEDFKDATSSIDSDDPKELAAEFKPEIAGLREAVAEARNQIEPLGDSDDKAAVLEALGSFDTALKKLDSLMSGLSDIGTFSEDIQTIGTAVEAADNATSDGINAANDKRWDEAANLATTAIVKYNEAEAKSAELEKEWPGLGMADMQQIIALKRAAAEKISALASQGRSGKTSAYNRTIKEYNDLQRQIRDAKQPAIIDNPDLLFADMEKTMEEIETEAEAALEALDKLNK